MTLYFPHFIRRLLVTGGISSHLFVVGAHAASGTWETAPQDDRWNNPNNWTSGSIPNAAGDTASFVNSNTINLRLTANVGLSGIRFESPSSSYTITIGATTMRIVGGGIDNTSGVNQSFSLNDFDSLIEFNNHATAGVNTTFTNTGGEIDFSATSSASGARLNNSEGITSFFDSSSASTAQISNRDVLSFAGASTAASSSVTNDGEVDFAEMSTAGLASIANRADAIIGFFDTSSAGAATLTNDTLASLFFQDQSSAGTASIINSGEVQLFDNAALAGAFVTNRAGGILQFFNEATAGNATVLTEDGGVTSFSDASSGGVASFITQAGGAFDISGLTSQGMTAGSIAGEGDYFLGSKNLEVGANNSSTTVSGAIQDGGDSGGEGGSLTKVGTGTLTLSGENSYTGPTVIRNGTLRAGAVDTIPVESALTVAAGAFFNLDSFDQSVGSIAGAGNITLGTAMLTTGNDDTSTAFLGVINGTGLEGGVTKVGMGTWTISGPNSYQGGTHIMEGILQAGAVNTLPLISAVEIVEGALLNLKSFNQSIGSLAGDGNLSLGSAILTTGNDSSDTLYAGVIDGVGKLIKVGTGTFTLEGENLHTGGTAIRGGVLEISSDANLGAETGLLVFATDLAIPGIPLSTLRTLEGIDSSRPVVLEGRGGSFDSLGNDSILRGSITGPGGLTKMSLGRLILAGTNRYTGGTTISGGILQIGAGGATGSVAGNITNNAALVFNRANSLTFPGVIRGSGTVTQAGSGRTILTGVNTYTGSTFIRRGELDVDGSTASANTFVFPGGTLGGTGTLLGNVFNSGVVSPGHSPGTLHIGGNYTQNVHGTLRIEVASRSNFDRLLVGKHAKLDGTLQLLSLGNFTVQRGDRLTFLTAGKISGTFADIQGLDQFSPAGTIISAEIIYTGTTVSLEAIQGSFAALPSLTRNQQAVARNLNKIVLDPRSDKLIDFLDREFLGNLPRDFDLIAPEELASIFEISFSLANVQNANLQRRTDDIRSGSSGFSAAGFAMAGSGPSYSGRLAGVGEADSKSDKNEKSVIEPSRDNPWGVFITGTGEFVDVGNTDNARGYDITTGGVTLGLDYRATPHFAFGVSAGYAGTGADLTDGGRVSVNGGKLGLYGTYFTGGFYLDGAVGGGYNNYDTKRTALHGSARGQTEGFELNALLGTGYDWRAGGLKIGPTATIQYSQVGINEFQERHSLAPLTIADQHRESLRSSLGLRASYDFKLNDHVLIRPEVRAAWQHELGDREYAIDSRVASGAGSIFTVDGPRMGRDSLLVSAGVAVQWSDRVSTYLSYDGQVARTNYQSHSFSGGVRVAF